MKQTHPIRARNEDWLLARANKKLPTIDATQSLIDALDTVNLEFESGLAKALHNLNNKRNPNSSRTPSTIGRRVSTVKPLGLLNIIQETGHPA